VPLTRIFLGIAALIRGPEAGRVLWGVLRPDVAHFPLIGLPLPPQNAVPLIVAAWMMLALAFTLGKWPKITGTLLVGLMAYTLLLDEQTYSNHLYLLILLIGIVSLAPRPEPLLRCQLTIVYTFAAVRKLTPVYLSGAVIAAHLPLSLQGLRQFEIMFPLAIASIFTEAFLAIAFWSARFRLAAWVVGIGLHGSCILLLAPGFKLQLTVFSLEMIALYTAFGIPHALRSKRRALRPVPATTV
jgi:hypothetical protein